MFRLDIITTKNANLANSDYALRHISKAQQLDIRSQSLTFYPPSPKLPVPIRKFLVSLLRVKTHKKFPLF